MNIKYVTHHHNLLNFRRKKFKKLCVCFLLVYLYRNEALKNNTILINTVFYLSSFYCLIKVVKLSGLFPLLCSFLCCPLNVMHFHIVIKFLIWDFIKSSYVTIPRLFKKTEKNCQAKYFSFQLQTVILSCYELRDSVS